MSDKKKDKKNFCPAWLLKVISCIIVYDYIVRDTSFFVSIKKFITFLSKNYDDIEESEVEKGAALILQFLGELKIDQNTYLLLNHYMYNIIEDTRPNEKGLFKSDPYEGTSEKKFSIDVFIDEFKVFSYSCRSGLTRVAPTGWDITNDENLGELGEVLNEEFSIDDMIDSMIKE